jgi:hypothetical protein
MKQTSQLRRGIVSGLIAAAFVAGCGQGSGVQHVETQPGAPAAAASGSLYADMSADAASQWAGSTMAPNFYPHGYDYGATDSVSTVAANFYPHGYDYGATGSVSTVAANFYPHGYDYGATDSTVDPNFYPHGYDYGS